MMCFSRFSYPGTEAAATVVHKALDIAQPGNRIWHQPLDGLVLQTCRVQELQDQRSVYQDSRGEDREARPCVAGLNPCREPLRG